MSASVVHDDFPITRNYAFLNHAASSPLPRVAVEALREYAADWSEHGPALRQKWLEKIESTRSTLASRLGCQPSEIAFCQNTTAAICCVANGVDWQPGDNVVLANVEYPANVYPWWAQDQRGVGLKFVRPENGRIRLEDFFAAADGRTRVMAVSHVQFATGFRADLDKLGTFCRDREILLLVDAIQSFGVFPINVKVSQISALACGVHKWLLCPPGLGFLYCDKDLCERLKVWCPGAESVVRPQEYLNYDLTYREGARRFEGGSLNLASTYCLEAVLAMLHEVGDEQVLRRVRRLTDHLCSGLRDRGCRVFSSRVDDEWSGIVLFTLEKHPSGRVVDALAKSGIITSVREDRIRVSPHFYNSEEEIDRLLAALP